MHFPAGLMPAALTLAAALLSLMTLLLAARFAAWVALREVPERMHLVAGGSLACLLLWLMNIHLAGGLLLHFLGVTTLTLVVGWAFAVLGATLALVAFFVLQGLEWSTFPLSVVLTAILPASLTWVLARALYRPHLRHPFIYILGAGFAGGGLAALSVAIVAVLLLWVSGLDQQVAMALEWWPMMLLIMFSEGFINGMCVAALAIFYPDAVKTFDDRFYLDS